MANLNRFDGIRSKLLSLLKGHTAVVGIVAGSLLLLLLLVIIASPNMNEDSAGDEIDGNRGPPAPTERIIVPRESAFLPNERERLLELEERRYREPRTPWDEEAVDRFWNPVRETAVEVLTEQGESEIDALFDSVE